MTMLLLAAQGLLIPALSPLWVGIIKKTKARLQNRRGASIVQPYRDLWKLFHKDEVLSPDASWVFHHAPAVVFAVTLVVGASIPLFATFTNPWTGDLLMVIYTLAIGTFFLALAGMDTGGGFGGFGASREMTVSALAEGGLIFSLLTLALLHHTTNLFAIAQSSTTLQGHTLLPILLALVGFLIVMLAETARFPFDNPATHLELTMIHEAMILEYSGKRLALMEWAAANKLFIFAAIAVNLFFPWGFGNLAIFLGKVLLVCLGVAILESSIAKFRFFRLPDLLLTAFILQVIAIGISLSL